MGLFSSSSAATREHKAERERQETEELLALAAHEIGHTIGCAAAGIEVRDVRLCKDRGKVTCADIDLTDQAKVDGGLVMTLAGWAAAAEWAHRHHGKSRSAALSWARGGARGDWSDFRRMKHHGSHGSGWYEQAAQKLVRAN
ncbi:hypothetical protein H4696_009778 [Amycolatopsis lexingtonensis]|uniref:Uncharacterized protein n=1 Tax=Amycolatopsis lexingtonensis TaxID=218822 RepID=A0ABR9IHL8_9PSEU|nr:hypothetical protein [Amycolatopsis lexingtonensis]MBE1502678.1 hypothetical protein [Amycolatopsis lexingtonensis]